MSVALSMDGRVVLVTGGSRGIGAATVRLFAQAGARVVFSYVSAEERAVTLARECGATAIQQALDSVEDGQALIAKAVAVHGRLDALVVNHGIWPAHDAPIASMTLEQWRGTLGTNLDSCFGLVRDAVAQMLRQESAGGARGHVVLVASTAAQRGEAFHADYAASKGAMISLTKSLSSELAPQGILCNCVAPGWVATEMSQPAFDDVATRTKVLATIPLGRPAHVDEIAGPIVFLCTPYAGFCSGEIFNVNGGAVLVG
ncbi:3-oxoacyl-[acyl-carrier protein] reductase [Granulicella pectinivorans]|uniref:3-oxoacyl-[acyl-carrier protein] reductase n=1 Tax=Granulicella pectinivorans TaxID=474950 RepID=A0A1I6L146_9BACT|nr:SDR family oxidoreductase [Granulicella pectinivorans]SFR97184.1 3-oxoacyl-[acyl-carrier protein] reductase [Granulicella pectinivorans]